MKVLLITGKLAEPLIRKIISETKAPHSFDLLVLPLAVAAFLHLVSKPTDVDGNAQVRLDQFRHYVAKGVDVCEHSART